MLPIGSQCAQQRWTEHQTRDQLPHNSGLFDSDHGLAKQPSDEHQQHELPDENEFGLTVSALGGQGRPRHECCCDCDDARGS